MFENNFVNVYVVYGCAFVLCTDRNSLEINSFVFPWDGTLCGESRIMFGNIRGIGMDC